MGVRWRYTVECFDRTTGVATREHFLFPADAQARVRQLRECGFFRVTCRESRVRTHGTPSTITPGFFDTYKPEISPNVVDNRLYG